HFGGKCRTKFRETRKARACLLSSGGDKRNLKSCDFVWLQGKIGKDEHRVVLGVDAKLVMARRQRKNSEDAFCRSRGAEDLSRFDVEQREDGRWNGARGAGHARVAHNTIQCCTRLRLLPRNSDRRALLTGFFSGVLCSAQRLVLASCTGERGS